MAVSIAVFSIVAFLLAYRFYGTFIQNQVLGIDPNRLTPSHELEDGVDFVPTNKFVLFGHHFASIAGLGPILGPAIAMAWGWLPALIWIVFGSIFMGAVHDFCALELSLRYKGRSIGEITARVIGDRARLLFLLIIFFLLALAMGVFALTIGTLFSSFLDPDKQYPGYPGAVLPTFGLMLIACAIGFLVYKKNVPLGIATVIGLVLLFAITLGGMEYPILFVENLAAKMQWHAGTTWVIILLAYAFIASVLPVWLLLQPRDFLNSFLLYASMGMIYLGLFWNPPEMAAPALHHDYVKFGQMFPLLFITIACGAVSGFHNLVSSGTTARQIDRSTDSKFVGYGGMLTEGALAVVVILACGAGLGSREEWLAIYVPEGLNGLGPRLSAVITGAGSFVASLGIPEQFAQQFLAVTIVAFAMTTLDSATRLLRYNVEEIGKCFRLNFLENRYVATTVAVIAIGSFALWKIDGRPAGILLWMLFGTTNQLLACLGLLVVTVYLHKMRRPTVYTLVPMVFMFTVTFAAIILQMKEFLASDPVPMAPLVVSGVVFFMAIWLTVEGILSTRKPLIHEEDEAVAVGVAS
ncbi:MAG: carbon starvation protein A [Candidatus Omnitrophica bacterium]|nr:carbon starvation protein A [Candidatus Omnitrophota bacterium]